MVRIGGDIDGIELEAGDSITVNGNEWVYQSDGTLEGPEIRADELGIDAFSNGPYTHVIFTPNGESTVYAIDRTGSVVAGGSENINVSNSADLAEILEHVVNNTSARTSIGIAAGTYTLETTANLDQCFSLFGPGRNSVLIYHGSGVENSDGISIVGASGNIVRFDSVKFDGRSGPGQPNRWLYMDNTGEILMTNVEMRNANNWSAECIGTGSPNYITNSWFIEGSGLRIENAQQVVATGNTFRGETFEVVGCDGFLESGNIRADFNIQNTTVENSFGNHRTTTLGTVEVSTSATSVYDATGGQSGNFVVVNGYDINDSSVRFTDLVLNNTTNDPKKVDSQTQGSPSTTSYTLSSDMIELEMGSGTYNVSAKGTSVVTN